MKMKKFISLLVILCVATAMLTACGRFSEKRTLSVSFPKTVRGTYQGTETITTYSHDRVIVHDDGYIEVRGTMQSGEIMPAAFVNTPYFELPETGGSGAEKYTIGGLLLIMAAGILLLYNHKKRGREDFSSS